MPLHPEKRGYGQLQKEVLWQMICWEARCSKQGEIGLVWVSVQLLFRMASRLLYQIGHLEKEQKKAEVENKERQERKQETCVALLVPAGLGMGVAAAQPHSCTPFPLGWKVPLFEMCY